MRLTALPQYKRDTARFLEITGTLAKFGLAEHLERIEPDFLQRWRGHENIDEVARLGLGERVRLACEALGPTFVKLGQILSTRPDLIPLDVAQELERLQSRAPADEPATARRIIEEELGSPVEELFVNFHDEPLASASIGQVHRAWLTDGQAVVVKVQHPGVEERVEVDFDILEAIAGLLERHDETARSLQLTAVIVEARRSVLGELDFRRELRHLTYFRRAFADQPGLLLPEPIPERSARRVLTMGFLEGRSVADSEHLESSGLDRRALALTGAHAFLDMVFRDGVFHADPHPGNVMVLDDGRLALLDFGMVGRVDRETQDDLLDLMLAFVQADEREILRIVRRIGSFPLEVDDAALRQDILEFQGELSTAPISEIEVGALLEAFTSTLRRHRIQLPPTVSMLVKLLIMLEGTSRNLDPAFSLMEVLRPYCEKLVLRRAAPGARARRALETGRDWTRLLGRLPGLLDDTARRIERGQVKIDMVHTGLEATVNRLVSGLLCAAMLLGGAMLWALKAPPVIAGIPVVGVFATLVALLHGIRLLWQVRQAGS